MQTMEKYQKNPALVILDHQVGKITHGQLWAIFAHIQYAAARRVSAALGSFGRFSPISSMLLPAVYPLPWAICRSPGR